MFALRSCQYMRRKLELKMPYCFIYIAMSHEGNNSTHMMLVIHLVITIVINLRSIGNV